MNRARNKIFIVLLLSIALIFSDYRFKLIFFKQNIEAVQNIDCNLVNELERLDTFSESSDNTEFTTSINRLRLQLGIAYALETGLSSFMLDTKSRNESRYAKELKNARSQFEKFAEKLREGADLNLNEVESTRKKILKFVKSRC
jgi:hypothetical protein